MIIAAIVGIVNVTLVTLIFIMLSNIPEQYWLMIGFILCCTFLGFAILIKPIIRTYEEWFNVKIIDRE